MLREFLEPRNQRCFEALLVAQEIVAKHDNRRRRPSKFVRSDGHELVSSPCRLDCALLREFCGRARGGFGGESIGELVRELSELSVAGQGHFLVVSKQV